MADLEKLMDALSELTVLEAAELVLLKKKLKNRPNLMSSSRALVRRRLKQLRSFDSSPT